MKKFIDKTKGAIAPLALVLVLSSQGLAQNESKDGNQTQERNQTQELNETKSVEWYGGLGFSTAKVTCPSSCEDVTYGLLGRLGYDFNEYVGIEGRLLKTMWAYEQQKIEHMGLFVKPMLPITEDFNIYGLLGFGKVETGHKIVFNDSGLAWGVGLNYNFGDDEEYENNNTNTTSIEHGNGLGIFIDYERLLQKSDAPDFDTVSFGLTYDF